MKLTNVTTRYCQPTRRRIIFMLSCILALATLTRVLCFRGYAGSDDGVYAELAQRIATGTFTLSQPSTHVPVFPLRMGLLAPTALAFAIAGPGQITMVMYPLLLSLVTPLLMFFAARSCFGLRAALIAAAICALVPAELFLATMLLPDLPAAFWANLAVLILFWGCPLTRLRSRIIYGILAGLSFALSWLCKESLVCMFPFVACYAGVLAYRRPHTIVLTLSAALAFFAVFATESLIYFVHSNDLLYRVHEAQRTYDVCKVLFFSEGGSRGWTGGGYAHAVAQRLIVDGPRAILMNPYLGFTTSTAVVAIAYALFRRLRAFAFPALWFLSLVVMFNFMSSTMESYRPLVLYDRYLYPLLFPAVLLTAGLLNVLMRRRHTMRREMENERVFWGVLIALPIACVCLAGVLYGTFKTRMLSSAEQTIAGMLMPSDVVYADPATVKALVFFWGFPEEYQSRTFEDLKGYNPEPGAYVVINRKKIEYARSKYNRRFPELCDNIPKSWLEKWSGKGVYLYEVPGKGAGP